MRRDYVRWWVAPAAASVFGQALDTAAFFGIAFWHSSNHFLAEHWGEIAVVDYVIKLAVSLLLFVPMSGDALNGIITLVYRRGGKEHVRTCCSGWWRYHYNNKRYTQ